MCGTEANLFRVSIEDAILNVCKSCSSYGKVLSAVKTPTGRDLKNKKKEESAAKEFLRPAETIFVIVPDYAQKIKKKREKLGIEQKEFAKQVRERDSLISKIETGSVEPNIKLARKLEKHLKIKLVEEYQEKPKLLAKSEGDGVTIGDMIKIKKR